MDSFFTSTTISTYITSSYLCSTKPQNQHCLDVIASMLLNDRPIAEPWRRRNPTIWVGRVWTLLLWYITANEEGVLIFPLDYHTTHAPWSQWTDRSWERPGCWDWPPPPEIAKSQLLSSSALLVNMVENGRHSILGAAKSFLCHTKRWALTGKLDHPSWYSWRCKNVLS